MRRARGSDAQVPSPAGRFVLFNQIRPSAVLLGCLCAASVACAQPAAAPPPAAAAAAGKGSAAWKRVFQDREATYYVDASVQASAGPADARSLVNFKIAQVIDGSQVWSVVAHLRLNCGQDQMITIDNTLYALQMGAGPVVETQTASERWHTPQPGTLGGVIWNSVCGKS
jgi:hypothetical protein